MEIPYSATAQIQRPTDTTENMLQTNKWEREKKKPRVQKQNKLMLIIS